MFHTRSRMDDITRDARHGLDDVMAMAGAKGRQAIDASEMVADEASRRIREYPLATVFAAAALGLFAGMFLSRD